MAAGKWNMQKASGGVASITVADGVGATNIVLPESGTVATTDNIVGFKNYIINGGFDIWQRGTSIPIVNGDYGGCDRYFIVHNEAVPNGTHERVIATASDGLNTKYYQRYNASASNWCTVVGVSQRIENPTTLQGKTLTFSFKARGTFATSVHAFGSGTIVQTDNILTSSWKKFIVKIEATDDLTANNYFEIGINLAGLQSSGTIDIAEWQLEEGSIATPFENRPIGLELSLCQRYYEVQYVNQVGGYYVGNQALDSINWSVLKRVVPTIAFSGINYNACNSLIVNGVSIYSLTPQTTSTNVLNGLNYTVSASAEL